MVWRMTMVDERFATQVTLRTGVATAQVAANVALRSGGGDDVFL
jgi:hypothetical protein